jgi:YD repeat-containing protein
LFDGTLGRKHFYEARGYTVTDCYNQPTDNKAVGGFSFAQFMAEIDAGRPVMLNLAGHTIVGVGYDASSNLVYLHDTWNYSNHTMTWGGSYSGMALQSVSIVNLATLAGSAPTVTTSAATSVTSTTATLNGTVNPNGSSTTAYFQYGTTTSYGSTTASQSMGSGTSAVAASANLTGLTAGGTYHFRIVAINSAGTSYGSDMSFIASSTPPSTYTLVVSVYPMKYGTVTLSPAGGSYAPGTQVTITARPPVAHSFTGWSGDTTGTITGTTNPITITMPSSNIAAIANFK